MANVFTALFARLDNMTSKRKQVLTLWLAIITFALIYIGHTKIRTYLYIGYAMLIPTLIMFVVFLRSFPWILSKCNSSSVVTENAAPVITSHEHQGHQGGTEIQGTNIVGGQRGNTFSQQNQNATQVSYTAQGYPPAPSGATNTTLPYHPVTGEQIPNNFPYPNQQGVDNPYPPPQSMYHPEGTNMAAPYPSWTEGQSTNMSSPYPPVAGTQSFPMGQQYPFPSAPPASYNLAYSEVPDMPPPSYDEVVKDSKSPK